MIRNYYLLTGTVLTFIAAAGMLFLVFEQIIEASKKSNNQFLKRAVLGLEVLIILSMVPGISRAFQTFKLAPVNTWAKAAAITRGLAYFLIAVLLLLIWFYKLKPEDE